ncbi:uncharacterized protein LOC106096455 isoform X2 [Oreochromis niloticus]|uniref:uncharacterized protein LOC106096455 isoform X2 n=1 Tax=Oreochromis niloticus TaxID=8128 RepID=UPI000905C13B|nr:uncharacterized protein LOC106096455 isoform X2 [Oreochromis niloticus]
MTPMTECVARGIMFQDFSWVSVVVAIMSTVQHLREFIKERLTSAAEEIFSEFEKTIVRYEEEISQLRLLNIRPGIKSHNTGLDDQQVCDQERSSSLNQEDPEPPQTKEEQEKICSSEEGEQLELKQKAEGIHIWTGDELDLLCKPGVKLTRIGLDNQQVCDQERSSSLNQEDPEPPQTKEEQEEMCSSEEGEQLELKQEAEGINVWTGEEVDLLWKSGVKLTTVDLPQQHDCKENEDLDDQQDCSQKRNSSFNQEDPEQEEMYTNQEGEQLSCNQETKGIIVWTGQELGIMLNPEVKLYRIEGVGSHSPVPHEAAMEEIQAPDMRRPPERKSSWKTNRGATMPPSRKELRRAPDEGSPSSHRAEARGGCSDVPVSSAGSQR